ncbi:MAG TPA: DUF202 domain-containing protein [Bryobacteraceae bacterium]
MSDDKVPPLASSPSTQLAIERTVLAHERTLMAWVRTATSLISFGFTIYKFFEGLRASGELKGATHLLGSRTFGLLMVSIGVVVLILATFRHQQDMRKLAEQYHVEGRSLALVLATLISLLGIVGLLAIIFRQ